MDSLPALLDLWRSTLNWQPNDDQQRQFQRLYEAVVAGNQRLNLTRITDPEEFWEKHLWDSLRGILSPSLPPLEGEQRLIDIGTGAGFPGLPAAIIRPDWKLTLVDSTRKKIQFIQETTETLHIPNVRCRINRAEELGQERLSREHYDIATIRAVGSASVCAEYTLPLLKIGGWAILYRGQWTDEETTELEGAIAELGGTLHACDTFTTPLTESARTCLIIQKTAFTPSDYPRPIGIPVQSPL
jgi:16S rRNA (guanine527-N7)-methyltransferase